MKDTDYMALAVSLAERGRGWTNPNPVVGAVLVKEGRIIGQGWHRRLGGLHAEREALAASREACRVVPAALGESLGDMAALGIAMAGNTQ